MFFGIHGNLAWVRAVLNRIKESLSDKPGSQFFANLATYVSHYAMMKRFFACAACCIALPSGAAVTTSPFAAARPAIPGEVIVDIPDNGTAVLRLADAVLLGLANNSEIRAAYLDRTAQKSTLKAMEDLFSPKLSLNGSHVVSQNPSDQSSQTEFSPTATMQSETGARFSLSWNNRISHSEYGVSSRDDGASFTVVQPLMRGAGRDIVTAPLRQARLNEQISRLNLKATVSDVITQIIFTYHEVLRAQEQSRLVQEASARAHRSLSYNTYRAAAGYWLESDFTGLVYAEADIAKQELALEEIENRLNANRQRLLRLLGLEANTKIHATDALEVRPVKVGATKTIAAALKQQPAYLIQRLLAERASIELAVAHDQRQWDVSLVGKASQTRSTISGAATGQVIQSRDNHAGIHIDIPIGDSSPRQIEARARANARNQDARLIEAKKALEHDIGESVRNLKARWRQCEAARRSLELARMKLEAEQKRVKKVPGDSFRVHVFESDLYNAEFARIDTLIAYRNALATIDKVSGTTLESWEIELND
jgi:outer membrane protein TolC